MTRSDAIFFAIVIAFFAAIALLALAAGTG